MEVKQKESNNKGRFYIEEDNQVLGRMMDTRIDDHHITIDHTEVNDSLKGKGAGKQLLTAAVEWARKNNVKIKPVCSFANSLFRKIKNFEDVLDH